MNDISIRNCCDEDCDYIYILANDSVYRKNSFNTNLIKYDEHLEWFEKSMKDVNRHIFIVEFKERDIGQIRIDINEDISAEISYMIEEKYRNKGIGTKLLTIIKERIILEFENIEKIIAKVKKENISSRNAFIKNGFFEKELDYYYEYSLGIRR